MDKSIKLPSFDVIFEKGIPALPKDLGVTELEDGDEGAVTIHESELASLITLAKELSSYFLATMAGEEAPIETLLACTEGTHSLDVLAVIATARMRSREIRLGLSPKINTSPERRKALVDRLVRTGVVQSEAEKIVDDVIGKMERAANGQTTKDGSNPGQTTGSDEVLDTPDTPEEEGTKPLPLQW